VAAAVPVAGFLRLQSRFTHKYAVSAIPDARETTPAVPRPVLTIRIPNKSLPKIWQDCRKKLDFGTCDFGGCVNNQPLLPIFHGFFV
jgi:hypothetical protein